MQTTKRLIAIILMPLIFLASASAADLAGGSWTKKGYTIKGKWSIVKDGTDTKVVLDEDFKTKKGPDLKIFFSPEAVADVDGKNATTGSVLVAKLTSYKGKASYTVPAGTDLSKFKSIIIHCEKYSKIWGAGSL